MCSSAQQKHETLLTLPQRKCFGAHQRIGCGTPLQHIKPMRELIFASFRKIFDTPRLRRQLCICMLRTIADIKPP